jgi:3-deoxy-D-manno-octulosonate 8-phosphate phosphatase KdsC-like HAD superfamily phosphatase
VRVEANIALKYRNIASADRKNRDIVIFDVDANANAKKFVDADAEKFFEISDNIAIKEKYLSDDSTEIRTSRRSTRTNKKKASIKFEANYLITDEYFSYTKTVINNLITEHDTNDSKSVKKIKKYFD